MVHMGFNRKMHKASRSALRAAVTCMSERDEKDQGEEGGPKEARARAGLLASVN